MIQLVAPLPHGVRQQDDYGSGVYGASRDGGARWHLGVDFIVACADEYVFSPLRSELVRVGYAYKDDLQWRLLVLRSSEDPLYSVRLLYVDPKDTIPGEAYEVGDVIGRAQDLRERYPADESHVKPITPHVHLELRYRGEPIDPTPYIVGVTTV